jgi:hypothetical protein
MWFGANEHELAFHRHTAKQVQHALESWAVVPDWVVPELLDNRLVLRLDLVHLKPPQGIALSQMKYSPAGRAQLLAQPMTKYVQLSFQS